ncbi:hypothetical protein KOR42_25850 [Thalassoglobus neptunius]|uniref:Zinc ribbon domain-containing protein n=1 Tax=Thalassoglobus neptunius TaxID=1938619 RepID=A0A5C5WXU3_9PLAN|nr:hypothetical protein [Thalassoglobus neptunius]TWT55774.1 hypothetical protein KOR42_25850 [Thalassoglobus neptunius]
MNWRPDEDDFKETYPDEFSEGEWAEDSGSEELTVPCAGCGSPMYIDADVCPVCGEFQIDSASASPLSRKPAWYVVLGIAGVIATIGTMLFLF